LDNMLAGLGDLFEESTRSGGIAGGLGGLLDTFRSSSERETADSWITPGQPTRGLTPEQVERAVGTDNLEELSRRTGLSREELLQRLATNIPEVVDRLTPDGNMPSNDDDLLRRW